MNVVGGRRWVLRSVPALALGAALPWAFGRSRSSYAGSTIPGAPVLPLVLKRADGQVYDLAAQHGRVVLVYFGYTNCPDVCPTTLVELCAATRDLAENACRVDVVFVTLDPRRDTGSILTDYLASFDNGDGARFIGLVGTDAETAEAAKTWDVTWQSVEGGRYFDHTSVVTMVGPDGRARLHYGYAQSADPAAVARDISELLRSA